MGIFLVAIKKKYGFSSNTRFIKLKSIGFFKFIDKGHENT